MTGMAGATTLTVGYHQRRRVVISKRLIGTVVVLAAAGGVLLPLRDRSSAPPSLAALVSASGLQARSVEPRLSGGFAWAPFQSATRGESAADGAITSAIGTTLTNVRGMSTPSARHTEAVAELLRSHPRKALSNLTMAAERSGRCTPRDSAPRGRTGATRGCALGIRSCPFAAASVPRSAFQPCHRDRA